MLGGAVFFAAVAFAATFLIAGAFVLAFFFVISNTPIYSLLKNHI